MDGEKAGAAAVRERQAAELQTVGRVRRGARVPRGDRRSVQVDQDGIPRRDAIALPARDFLREQGFRRRGVHATAGHGVVAGRARVAGWVPVQAARHARAQHGCGHRREGVVGANGAGAGVDSATRVRGRDGVPRVRGVSAAAVPRPRAAPTAARPGQIAGGGQGCRGHNLRLAGLQEGQVHPRQGVRLRQALGGPETRHAPGTRGAEHRRRHLPAVRRREARARVPQEGCWQTVRQGYPARIHVGGFRHGEQRVDGGGDGAAVHPWRRRVRRGRRRALGRRLLGCLHATDRRLHAGFVGFN